MGCIIEKVTLDRSLARFKYAIGDSFNRNNTRRYIINQKRFTTENSKEFGISSAKYIYVEIN